MFSAGCVGHRLLRSCSRRQRRVLVGSGARRSSEAVNERRENTDYLPGDRAAAVDSRVDGPGAGLRTRTSSCSPSRRRPSGRTSPRGRRSSPRSATLVSLMKGVELGPPMRMSEVIPGGHRCLRRPDRRRQRTQPGARDRPPRAGCVRRRLPRRGARQAHPGLTHGPSWGLHLGDVLGCEIGGADKNVVGLAVGMAVGLGFGDNTTASVITRGLRRPRAGDRAGRQPADPHGSRRPRRPRRHVLVAALAQPHLRERLGQGMTTEEIYASTVRSPRARSPASPC